VLTPLSLGDSATVRVGQSVVAIGNALGRYQNTVTSGIISGKGRPVTAATSGNSTQRTESLTDLIQTDAAVNSGNSGGPLLNRSGQVIGINVAVATNAQGISFAIPVNAMKGTLKSVLAGKGVRRAYLGARYVMLTPDIAKQVGASAKEGAYVMTSGDKSAIVAGSPADKAGLREKDVITKINSLVVGKQGDVSSLIGEYQPGDVVALTILRDGKERVVRVTLSEYQGGESRE
jgi:peptidase Do